MQLSMGSPFTQQFADCSYGTGSDSEDTSSEMEFHLPPSKGCWRAVEQSEKSYNTESSRIILIDI